MHCGKRGDCGAKSGDISKANRIDWRGSESCWPGTGREIRYKENLQEEGEERNSVPFVTAGASVSRDCFPHYSVPFFCITSRFLSLSSPASLCESHIWESKASGKPFERAERHPRVPVNPRYTRALVYGSNAGYCGWNAKKRLFLHVGLAGVSCCCVGTKPKPPRAQASSPRSNSRPRRTAPHPISRQCCFDGGEKGRERERSAKVSLENSERPPPLRRPALPCQSAERERPFRPNWCRRGY